MPAIVLTLLQGLLLLLLYLFIGRAVRAVLRDVAAPAPGARPAPIGGARPQRRPSSREKRVVPRQLVVHAKEGNPRVVELGGMPILFGRATDVTVQLTDPFVSDHHARIHQEGNNWMITDLQSTNGTFVNQVKVSTPTPIAAGDQLGIGRTVVEVRK